MNPVDELIKEHEEVERELLELEEITSSNIINLPNLIHVLNKICIMWDPHEKKENEIFPLLEKKGFIIPIDEILCQHGELKTHFNIISKAIKSGSEFNIKNSLNFNGKTIIKKLREHKDFEDEILYTIPEDIKLSIE